MRARWVRWAPVGPATGPAHRHLERRHDGRLLPVRPRLPRPSRQPHHQRGAGDQPSDGNLLDEMLAGIEDHLCAHFRPNGTACGSIRPEIALERDDRARARPAGLHVSIPHPHGVDDKLRLIRRYGRRRLPAERSTQNPVDRSARRRPGAHETDALPVRPLKGDVVAVQGPAGSARSDGAYRLRAAQPINHARDRAHPPHAVRFDELVQADSRLTLAVAEEQPPDLDIADTKAARARYGAVGKAPVDRRWRRGSVVKPIPGQAGTIRPPRPTRPGAPLAIREKGTA